jgi:hypothetical protein
MKLTTLLTVATATIAIAAPTPDVAETDAAKRDYSGYGSYPPPAGGYGSYGTYGAPAGGYKTYGSYKRTLDWLKSLF